MSETIVRVSRQHLNLNDKKQNKKKTKKKQKKKKTNKKKKQTNKQKKKKQKKKTTTTKKKQQQKYKQKNNKKQTNKLHTPLPYCTNASFGLTQLLMPVGRFNPLVGRGGGGWLRVGGGGRV